MGLYRLGNNASAPTHPYYHSAVHHNNTSCLGVYVCVVWGQPKVTANHPHTPIQTVATRYCSIHHWSRDIATHLIEG